MKYSKKDAIRIVIDCAEAYQKELNNKKLLFICLDKNNDLSYLEFSFHDFNFLHLTGLRLNNSGNNQIDAGQQQNNASAPLNAYSFYERCLAHKLSPGDFSFTDPNTTFLKLDILPSILNKNLSAKMIGDYNSSKPKLYTKKLVGGTKACMGFVFNEKLDEYVPNTVIKEDIRNYVSSFVRIIATYRKSFSDDKYSEIVYAAKNIDWSKINFSGEYSYLPKPDFAVNDN